MFANCCCSVEPALGRLAQHLVALAAQFGDLGLVLARLGSRLGYLDLAHRQFGAMRGLGAAVAFFPGLVGALELAWAASSSAARVGVDVGSVRAVCRAVWAWSSDAGR